jgi:hypothetical protein
LPSPYPRGKLGADIFVQDQAGPTRETPEDILENDLTDYVVLDRKLRFFGQKFEIRDVLKASAANNDRIK